MAGFSDLPSELVQHILSFCKQAELYSTSCVSKSLYTIALPFLYTHVDVRIRHPKRAPAIDKLLRNVVEHPNRAKYVKTLKVGLTSNEGLQDVQDLPHMVYTSEKYLDFQNDPLVEFVLSKHPFVEETGGLLNAVGSDCYGAYATFVILMLPCLHRLEVSGHGDTTLYLLFKIMNLFGPQKASSETTALIPPEHSLNSITEVSYMIDSETGRQLSQEFTHIDLRPIMYLPGLKTLEFFVPDQKYTRLFGWPHNRHFANSSSSEQLSADCITSVVIRYSSCISEFLGQLLSKTPQLRSLTCEMWYDFSTAAVLDSNTPWINLSKWNSDLNIVRNTLEDLTLSVEYCHAEKPFFQQPDIRDNFSGHLDLKGLRRLHRLEVPVPFITGDPNFSIATIFEPHLPSSLRHLSLRTDMSRAQFPFPVDLTLVCPDTSFETSAGDTQCRLGARMDLSSIFQTSLTLLDQLTQLESISVWQPADAALNWVDYQLQDLATTCENKSRMAKVIYPQMVRSKKREHWDLVKELTLFDPSIPDRGRSNRLIRGDRDGIILGLASQYHLHELQKGYAYKWN